MIVPVYRASRLGELVHRVLETADDHGFTVELILVDDASPDDTWKMVLGLSSDHVSVRGIRLGNNAGQHAATLCGLRAASGPILVTLDDDLKHPPEAIPSLLAALHGDVDLVYGAPRDIRALGFRSRLGRHLKDIAGQWVGLPGAGDMTSFRAMRQQLVALLPAAIDRTAVLDPLLGWYADTTELVRVDSTRPPTATRYRTLALANMLLDGMITFGAGRVRPLLVAGAAISAGGTGLAAWRMLPASARHSGPSGHRCESANLSDAVLLVVSGLQLVALAMVTEHVQRIQVRTAGQLPYWIRETTGGPPESAGPDLSRPDLSRPDLSRPEQR